MTTAEQLTLTLNSPPKSSNGFTPSPYQQAIFDSVRQGTDGPDLFVSAVAGSGKTTTIVQAARFIDAPGLFAAFNVAIVAELTTANEELERENRELCRTNDHQDEVIRRQQATIDELNEVVSEHAAYAAYLEEKLEQERARADGLQTRLDGLSAALFAENRLLPPRLAKWHGKDGRPR